MVDTRTEGHGVVLFDGVCNLCSGAVQFIVERDPTGYFRFAPLQSDVGSELLRDRGPDPDSLDTIVLLEDGQVYTKSDAAVRIARRLAGPARHFRFLGAVPRPLRDLGYDAVARIRYPVFGKKDSCLVPTEEMRSRFLETSDGRGG